VITTGPGLSMPTATATRNSRPLSHPYCCTSPFSRKGTITSPLNAYLAEHNTSPKPFVWTQAAEAIMAKLERCPVTSV
jgi:hypothetical protein